MIFCMSLRSSKEFAMSISQQQKCKYLENWNSREFVNVDSKYAVSFHKITINLLIIGPQNLFTY